MHEILFAYKGLNSQFSQEVFLMSKVHVLYRYKTTVNFQYIYHIALRAIEKSTNT